MDVNISACFGHPDCACTGGYYIGGGMYICWLHGLLELPPMVISKLTLQALPKIKELTSQNVVAL